jgi:hypothetical protein
MSLLKDMPPPQLTALANALAKAQEDIEEISWRITPHPELDGYIIIMKEEDYKEPVSLWQRLKKKLFS